jgi:uncharacterized membrane protein YfcA
MAAAASGMKLGAVGSAKILIAALPGLIGGWLGVFLGIRQELQLFHDADLRRAVLRTGFIMGVAVLLAMFGLLAADEPLHAITTFVLFAAALAYLAVWRMHRLSVEQSRRLGRLETDAHQLRKQLRRRLMGFALGVSSGGFGLWLGGRAVNWW